MSIFVFVGKPSGSLHSNGADTRDNTSAKNILLDARASALSAGLSGRCNVSASCRFSALRCTSRARARQIRRRIRACIYARVRYMRANARSRGCTKAARSVRRAVSEKEKRRCAARSGDEKWRVEAAVTDVNEPRQ